MGQQQLLLIILGVIVVGIAIAVGVSMFSSSSVQANRDALVNDMNNIAANAYQYRIRPGTMGGGDGDYTNYFMPQRLQANENGSFMQATTAQAITFTAISAQGYGKIAAVCDSNGRLGNYTYSGQFQ